MIAHVWVSRCTPRLALIALAALAAVLPFAEGVLVNGLVALPLLIPTIWLFFTRKHEPILQNVLLLLVTTSVTLCMADLLLRPLIWSHIHYSPLNMFTRRLPELPILGRFDASIDFRGDAYGDLAAIIGDPGFREMREVVLRTDEAGFRNSPDQSRPIEVLALGDSFVGGWGTTQDRMFSQVLETRYGRKTYNLGFPASPWEEFANFIVESPRMNFAPHAMVVWALYTGNDLYEPYRSIWTRESLPWNGRFGAWIQRWKTFRARSPLRQIFKALLTRSSRQAVAGIVRHLPDGRPILFTDMNNEMGALSQTDVEGHPHFAKLEETLAAMRTAVAAQGLSLTVVIVPTKQEVYRWILEQRNPKPEDLFPSGFAQAVLSACGRVQLRCLDPKPYMMAEAQRLLFSSGELLWWRDDTHFGERGHEAMADFIVHYILESHRDSIGTNVPMGERG